MSVVTPVTAYAVINEDEFPTKVAAIPVTDDNRSDFDKGLEAMKRVALELRVHGPRNDQLKAYNWFSSNAGWDSKWPLQKAAMKGDISEIKRLLESGVDANCKMTDWFDSEPLGWAASFSIVALVEGGADPRRPPNKAGNNPMADATRENASEVIELLDAFLSNSGKCEHAGQGTRANEYEANYATVFFPIAGHPEFDKGAYHHYIGCCCYTKNKLIVNYNFSEVCCNGLFVGLTAACWLGTLCYQPCGLICAGKFPWFGDCICSEQRVTHTFVEKFPSRVTKGPAAKRYKKGLPTKYGARFEHE